MRTVAPAAHPEGGARAARPAGPARARVREWAPRGRPPGSCRRASYPESAAPGDPRAHPGAGYEGPLAGWFLRFAQEGGRGGAALKRGGPLPRLPGSRPIGWPCRAVWSATLPETTAPVIALSQLELRGKKGLGGRVVVWGCEVLHSSLCFLLCKIGITK